jgi:RNA polymerase sigma-70 factor (ECF subfamily)
LDVQKVMIVVSNIPATDPSLLVKLRDPEDSSAWGLFLAIYSPLIERFCLRRGLQEADALDVSQEVLSKVARAIRSFEYRPERGRFRDWLGSIVRSRLSEFHARCKRQASGRGEWALREGLIDDLQGEVDAEWTDHFHDHLLRVAMNRARPDFDSRNWRAFELSWIRNLPVAEVARELEIPVSAVYTARFRVLERLRKELLLLAENYPCLDCPE